MISALQRIGLNKSEADVYIALLRLGEATVVQIARESNVHRTNVYAMLDKLQGMGLVTEFSADHKKHFRAADPKNLLNYLEETQSVVANMLPDLENIRQQVHDQIEVDVYRGTKGMKSAYRELLRESRKSIGYNVAGQLRKYLPVFAQQWIRDATAPGGHHRYIYVEGTEYISPNIEVRTIQKEFLSPVATQIHGNKIFISIWEPTLLGIMITSKHVADTYRINFELLWSIAKKQKKKIKL